MATNVGLTPAPTGSTPSGHSSGAPQHPPAASGGTTGGSNSAPVGSNSNTSSSGDVTISECYMSDSSWLADLRLDLAKSYWEEWSFLLYAKCDRLGFSKWLKGTLPQLDALLHPKAHDIWETNDCSLRGFIFERISKSDYGAIANLPTAHEMFTVLQQRHEKLGAHAQLLLLKKALDFRYGREAPFCDGADEILAMHNKISNMGPVDWDQIKIILLLNAFGNDYDHIQSSLFSAMDSPNFSAATIIRRLQQEDAINRACVAQSSNNATALAAVRRDKPPRLCSNCKKEGHLVSYCIKQGGGMAGKTLDEARAAQ